MVRQRLHVTFDSIAALPILGSRLSVDTLVVLSHSRPRRPAQQQAALRNQKELQGGKRRRAPADGHVDEHQWIQVSGIRLRGAAVQPLQSQPQHFG